MAYIYVVADWFGAIQAAFTFPELASEYAEELTLIDIKRKYTLTRDLDVGLPHETYMEKLTRHGFPVYDYISDYSDQDLITIALLFRPLDVYLVKEVRLIA